MAEVKFSDVKTFVVSALTTFREKLQAWANGRFALKSELPTDYLTDEDIADLAKTTDVEKTYRKIADSYTKDEVDQAIEAAKEAIVGEDLKDSLDTLESIKSWKEEHGTEYTNLLAEVQKKLSTEDAAKTYQTIAGMADYATKAELEGYVKADELTAIDEATWKTIMGETA